MRRVLGTAQTSPGLQVWAGRKICRPARNRATRAAAMKKGRYGSSLVRFPIQAPLKPNATRMRGPRQHVEARMAARPPTKSAPDPVRSREFSTVPNFICDSPAGSFLLRLGNARGAYGVPCRNSARLAAARPQASEGGQVFAARQPVFPAICAVWARTAASDFLAD